MASSKPELLNLEELFTVDDYPQIAQRNGLEGAVKVLVEVDPAGFVSSCTVTRSSGHTSLDEQTCGLFRARAQFAPARDSRGRAVASQYHREVVWRLEGDAEPPLPRQAWMIRTASSVDASGKLISCKAEVVGIGDASHFCAADGTSPEHAIASREAAAEAITEIYFYPAERTKVTLPPERTDAAKFAQQVSSIEIDSEGRVSACDGIEYSGQAGPENDLCSNNAGIHFVPAAPGPVLKGTLVIRFYLRQQRVV